MMTSDEFKEVQEGVRNYVIKMCGYLSIDDQMDLEQDAMLQAVRYQHTYDPTKSSLKTWGRNIAFSVSWRQEQKRRSRNSKARMVPFDDAFGEIANSASYALYLDTCDD